MMKLLRRFLACTAALCLAFCTPCLAAQSIDLQAWDMALQVPDDFTVINADNVQELGDVLYPYDVTVTETAEKLEREHYGFLAISSAMRCTLFLSRREDAVSRSVGDLIRYEDEQTAEKLLLGDPLPESYTVQRLEREGALFLRVDCGVTDGIGRIAYITVMNGACYTLCVVDNNGALNDNVNALIDRVFDTWDYTIEAEAARIGAFKDTALTVAFWVLVPLGLIAAGFIIRSLVRDWRERRLEADRRRIVPKKPRR